MNLVSVNQESMGARMDRKYFYDKHRQNELSKLEQGNRKKQNTEFFLQQNPTTSYNKIPNMKTAYEKVRKNDHITIDPEYERLTSSTFRYK